MFHPRDDGSIPKLVSPDAASADTILAAPENLLRMRLNPEDAPPRKKLTLNKIIYTAVRRLIKIAVSQDGCTALYRFDPGKLEVGLSTNEEQAISCTIRPRRVAINDGQAAREARRCTGYEMVSINIETEMPLLSAYTQHLQLPPITPLSC